MADFSQAVVANAREFNREAAPLKTRVHALAKQLGLSSKEMIETLGHAGIVVKAASSTVNQNQLEAVLNLIIASDAPAPEKAEEVVVEKPAQEEPVEEKPAKKRTRKRAATKKTAAKKKVENKSEKTSEESTPDIDVAEVEVETEEQPRKAKKAAQKKTAKKAAKQTSKRSPKKNAEIESADAPAADASVDAPADAHPENAEKADRASESVKAEAQEASSENKVGVEQVGEEKPKRRRRVRRTTRKAAPQVSATEDAADEAVEASSEKVAEVVSEPVSEPDVARVAEPVKDVAEAVEPVADAIAAAPLFIAPHAPTAEELEAASASYEEAAESGDTDSDDEERQPRPRRRRRGRGRRRVEVRSAADGEGAESAETVGHDESGKSSGSDSDQVSDEEAPIEEPQAIRGSTRLEAQRRRRNERREQSRKRHVLSEAEFLARRESVERTMVVRERKRHDHAGIVTEVGVLEDDLLVEHFVTSDTQTTQIGNIYLGRVQNVLPSMEAAFVDIGTDRNAVIYVGDLNWKLMGIKGRSRKIEQVLKSGDQILVQVTKDPIGHKGARLTTHISLAGRFLVYVPGGRSAGISRKLPEPERKRLKDILHEVTPEGSGTIIRTAAEGVSKEAIADDVKRLEKLWNDIWDESEKAKARKGAKPISLYEEPDMLVKVVRDVFNEDFTRLVVEGDRPWNTVTDYIGDLAPELESRLQRYFPNQHGGEDVFAHFRIDEQLAKALDRKVWLPSGGTLVIDRTEAMTVIDVNTGKFTGSGGNLEETVTRNNLEAAEEIVRQMRLRDLGGMIVVDFIDMVLPENQDLVLRRLKEALGRDRTRHEVSEVTSLGLVQMTRKRLGTGLLETFSTPCSCCGGRGITIHIDPVEQDKHGGNGGHGSNHGSGQGKRGDRKKKSHDPQKHPAAIAMHKDEQQPKDHTESRGEEYVEKQLSEAEASEKRVADAVDALVVSSEKEEPRPPQRRARRERKDNGDRGARREQSRSERSLDDGTRRDTQKFDEHDDLAALAAAAVAEAREKDPEEPSDDRYVLAHTGRRRRRVVRTRRPIESEAGRAAESDDRAGQTVKKAAETAAEAKETKEPEASEAKWPDTSEKTEGARRGRRRVRRVRRVTSTESQAVSRGDQAAAAEHGSDTTQSAKKQKPLEEFQTYEKALAEFEASPRRRRPTRGKSRSDREPRREDFETKQSQRSNSQENQRDKEERPVDTERKSRVTVQRSSEEQGTGRRRRRAVRRTTRPVADQASASGARKGADSEKPAERVAKDTAAGDVEKRTVRRRGGRRAVRRTSRPNS